MRLLFTLCLFLACSSTYAYKILEELDFEVGEWVLVGVPIQNYRSVEIQENLKTFINQDTALMRKLQREWDFEMTFNDKCDEHYALKFYRDGELQTTLKVNLYCGYLTMNQLAYDFDPKTFELFRNKSKPLAWSEIKFGDQSTLRRAIEKLSSIQGVYWYDDEPKAFAYSGYLMLQYRNLSWDADNDSLRFRTKVALESTTGSDAYFLEEYLVELSEDQERKRVVFRVHCEKEFADLVTLPSRYLRWKSHWEGRDSISIYAIGIDRRRYKQIMQNE